MAIEKMKRLRLMAVKSEREELMKQLMLLGCVEISEPDDLLSDEETSSLLTQETAGLSEYRADYDRIMWGIELINQYSPTKSPLLAPKPEVNLKTVLDESNLAKTIELASTLDVTDDQIRRIDVEASHIRGLNEALEPWKAMDVPLNLRETKTCNIIAGTVPAATDLKQLETQLNAAAPESQIFKISTDKEMHYILFVFMKCEEQQALELMRAVGFAQSSVSELHGTAADNILQNKRRLAQLEKEKRELSKIIIAAAPQRDEMKLCADRMLTKAGKAENDEKLLCTDSTVTFEGWVPARKEAKLSELLSRFDCAWETEDPKPEEYPDVPVKLTNGRFARPLNMVTEMYSLPAYDGIDPNPLMAPFFIMFYGIMMADMGYGILMMLAGFLVIKKKRPSAGMRNFFELLFECGISTFFWGILTGSFFGDAALQVAKLINPETTFAGLPSLFTPLDNTLEILIAAMAIGFVQIITGMVINFIKKTKDGHLADALMDEGSWWLVFLGIGIGALTSFWWVAIAGVFALIATQGRDKPTIGGKLVGGIASLYDITGYFGDILSYSRLMALMLAGSVIAQVFNTLGAIPGNIFVFFIIFIIGHALNFGLNLLGCYVHDLRLQCLEYFGKFYKDGGRAFKPLTVNTQYYDVVE